MGSMVSLFNVERDLQQASKDQNRNSESSVDYKQVHCLYYGLSDMADDVQCRSFQTQILFVQ